MKMKKNSPKIIGRPKPTLTLIAKQNQIQQAVRTVAAEILNYYTWDLGNLVMLCNLKGGTWFFKDLYDTLHSLRLASPIAIHPIATEFEGIEFDFIQTSSYENKTKSSNEIAILKNYKNYKTEKHILIVDDIMDTGRALRTFIDQFVTETKTAHSLTPVMPKTLRTCVLVNKTLTRKEDIQPDFTGLEVKSGYLVGYGMGVGDKYRCLPDIYKYVEPDEG
jgi:hypoxanthine phosphoribosyltransferase